MEYRRMGKTGLQLSVLSYGSWVTFANQNDDGIAKVSLLGKAAGNLLRRLIIGGLCKDREVQKGQRQ